MSALTEEEYNQIVTLLKSENTLLSSMAFSDVQKLNFEQLKVALRHEEPLLRHAAVNAFGNLGDKRAIDLLINALNDVDVSVCVRALLSLAQLSDKRAIEPIIELLVTAKQKRRWSETDTTTIMIAVMTALKHLGGQEVVNELLARLKETEKR